MSDWVRVSDFLYVRRFPSGTGIQIKESTFGDPRYIFISWNEVDAMIETLKELKND